MASLTDVFQAVKAELTSSLQLIQERSMLHSPAVIGCIQSICVGVDDMRMSPQTVTTASAASRSFHTGILVLEKQIEYGIAAADGQQRAKRARVEVSPEVTMAWVELAKLYKPVGEFDVLLGIFSQKVFRAS